MRTTVIKCDLCNLDLSSSSRITFSYDKTVHTFIDDCCWSCSQALSENLNKTINDLKALNLTKADESK